MLEKKKIIFVGVCMGVVMDWVLIGKVYEHICMISFTFYIGLSVME